MHLTRRKFFGSALTTVAGIAMLPTEAWSKTTFLKEQRKASPGDTSYYIDPLDGSDGNSGTSKEYAWRTFKNINRLRLSPGDRVEVVSPGSFDRTLALMGEGTVDNPVEVHFAPGRYDLFPGKALKRKYQISNTNNAPDEAKAIGVLLERAKHFSVLGKEAYLVYRGKMIEVCIDTCEAITINGFQFDYHRPTVSEFKAVSVDDDYVDLKIHEDSKYKIKDGSITWVGEGWSYKTNYYVEFNPCNNTVWRRRNVLSGMWIEEIRPFLIRARGKHSIREGRVFQARNIRRDCAGVFIRRSKDVVWKNCNFYFMHGMGFVAQFSENLTFDSVSIAPDPESGRTNAAWADSLQVSGCRGKVLVKDCVFCGSQDDHINIHGTYLQIVEVLSEKKIKVRFAQRETFGFMAFNKEDEIAFIKPDTLKIYGGNRVRKADLLNPKEMLLELKVPLPAALEKNDVVENVTWNPEVEIRGCTASRTPTQHFLVTTRRKVVIENNVFYRQNADRPAIKVANDARGWYESSCVRDMTIRNNTFLHSGDPAIRINPKNTKSNDSVHRNILIEDNRFFLPRKAIVEAHSVTGLTIRGNVIEYPGSKPEMNQLVRIKDCADTTIGNNKIEQYDCMVK